MKGMIVLVNLSLFIFVGRSNKWLNLVVGFVKSLYSFGVGR